MKTNQVTRWLGLAAISFLLLSSTLAPNSAEAKNLRGVSFQVFYDALTPYGDWVKDARYGYIWLPAVYEEFHPYGTNGHWVMTEFGNTWVSDYDWGWATFHYGRWYFDDYYQSWAWIPGYEWAPAWVSWRSGGGYYGWAPLGPAVSINVRINIPTRNWIFIPHGRIYHRNVYGYYSPYAHHRTKIKIINRTTVINNTVVYNNYNYFTGPSRREIERSTRQIVPVYNVRSSEAPGRAALSRNEVRLYRPEIEQPRGRSVEARPSRVLEADEVRSARSSRTLSPGNSNTGQSGRSESPSNGNPGRSVNPSRNASEDGVDLSPAPADTRSRGGMSQPTRSTQPSSNTSARPQSAPARDPQVRTQPGPSRESQVRTQPQPAPRERVEQRGPSPSRSSEARQPQQRTQPSPQVRTAPSRSSEPRVSQPARSQSNQPQVRQAAPARSSAPAGRTESSAPSRGNNRDRNN